MRFNTSFLFCGVILALGACARGTDVQTVAGKLTMGHEVRAFVPDGQDKEYWLIDKSGKLYKEYLKIAPVEAGAYVPVRAELKVNELPKMQDGFGAEYDGTYNVVEIISVQSLTK